jgi:endo-1,4-beta-mannosidase
MRYKVVDDIIFMEEGFRFLLGVNYWSRKNALRMWIDWNENSVREDFSIMRKIGVRVVRMFIKDEDFADENGEINQHMLDRLRRFLDIAYENKIMIFLTFLVGHMSGKNWRIPWVRFEDLYKSHSIEKTMRFVKNIVERFKDHPAVAGWILSNELSLVKRAENRDEALKLLKAFSETIRSIDKDHLISSGDVPDSYMQETPNIRGIVDYVGPHLYIFDTDDVRQGFSYGAFIELFRNSGDLPLILEEFGFSTALLSEELQARAVEEVLYTALAHDASGAFIWCFSDFSLENEPPYEWRPLELRYGLVRYDGSLKPSAEVVKRFSETISSLERLGFHIDFKRRPETSIVTPFYVFRDYEFVWYRNGMGFWRVVQPLIISSMLLSSAGVDNTMIYELDLEKVLNKRKLLVMPSLIVALSTTWRKLLRYVEEGGNLYISLSKGFGDYIAGYEAATHLWSELMGVENKSRTGALNIYRGRITISFIREFNEIDRDSKIIIDTPTSIYTYYAEPVDADVLAVDASERPVLFRTRRGRGNVYTMLIPIEMILALSDHMNLKDPYRKSIIDLFRSIALESGVEIRYRTSSSQIEVKPFYGKDSDILIIINHGDPEKISIESSLPIKNVELISRSSSERSEIIKYYDNKITLSIDKKETLVLNIKH